MFCQNCGAKLPEGVNFCPSCGAKVMHTVNPSVSGQGSAAGPLNSPGVGSQSSFPGNGPQAASTAGLAPARCTNCGAALEVDPAKDAAICPYCNTPYIVQKAIQNYKITNIHIGTQINIQGANAGNLLKLADQALACGKYREAVGYADRALETDPANTDAWIIKIKAAGYDIEGDRSSEIASYMESALNFDASDEDEIRIYAAILDVASIHIGRAAQLLSANTDSITRQLKAHPCPPAEGCGTVRDLYQVL